MARIRRHRRDTVQSPLETYLREINEVALLTADEEKMLAKRIEAGDEAALGGNVAGDFEEALKAFALKQKVDPQRAMAALSDVKLAEAVEKDVQEGVARGVSKTPTVFVNGEPFVETFTIEEISKAIDTALAEYKQ